MTAASPAAAGERIELADVLNRYGDAYRRDHYLRPSQAKVIHAIRCCRTAALGGHCEWCSGCGFVSYAYQYRTQGVVRHLADWQLDLNLPTRRLPTSSVDWPYGPTKADLLFEPN